MKSTDHGTRNLFATFSLRGGRLRKRGRGVVSYAPFLMGAASAFVLGSLSALSTPSLAQPVDRLNVAAIDDVVAGNEGWIIAIDDVAADAGGWITAVDDIAVGRGGGIVAYAAEAGGGFAAFGGVTTEVGGGIAAFGRVEEEIAALAVEVEGGINTHAAVPGSGLAKLGDGTSAVDDIVVDPGEKTLPIGVTVTTTATTTTTNTIVDRVRNYCGWCTPIGSTNTTVTTSGTVGGENTGVYVSRSSDGDIDLTNEAVIDDVYYGIQSVREGEGIGWLNIVNEGRITNAEYGVHATHIGKGGLGVRAENSESGLSGEIVSSSEGIFAQHGGEGVVKINVESGAKVVSKKSNGVLVEFNGEGLVDALIQGEVRGDRAGFSVAREGRVSVEIQVGPEAEIYGGVDGIQISNAGPVDIDVAGSVSGAGGNAISMVGARSYNTLILRPGFSLNGAVVSSKGGELELERQSSPGPVAHGVLDLGAEEFVGFDKFSSSGNWVVTGEASEHEAFGYAVLGSGILRFLDVDFKIKEDDPHSQRDERGYFIVSGDTLEIEGTNRLGGDTINNGGWLVFVPEDEDGSLTIDGYYRARKSGMVFNVDLAEQIANKLIILGNVIASPDYGQRVLMRTPGTSGVASSLVEESPVLIEVHGSALAGNFQGKETVGAFDYVLKHDVVDGVNMWRFHQDGISSSADTSSDLPSELADRTRVEADRDDNSEGGVWAYRHDFRSSLEATLVAGGRSRVQDNRVHFGFDVPATSLMGGNVAMGASMWQGVSASDGSSGDSVIGVESSAAALTALWWSSSGFYADGRAQYVNFSSNISADRLLLVRGNEGIGIGALAEMGYRFAARAGGIDFHVVPQMELIWSRVDFDDFVGRHDELVSLEDGDLMTGRLGLSWDGEWRDAGGSGRVYGGVNLHGALDGKMAVNVSGSSLASEQRDLSFDGRLGVSYEWKDGYAIHSEAIALRHRDVREVRADLGIRIDF